MHHAAQIPGPGEYNPEVIKSKACATFGNFNPPSDIDILIRRGGEEPGPGDYGKTTTPPRPKTLKVLRKELGTASNGGGRMSKSATRADSPKRGLRARAAMNAASASGVL